MIKLFNKTGNRAFVSKIIVDGEEVEYSDEWSVVSPHREYSDAEWMLMEYVRDKENKIGELQERVYVIENRLKELERVKRERSKKCES